ncbi:thioredoxin-related transmembrane protein 4 [Trichosurus vulpecula]|uniref:thioredoxin-related transmembrane protein 4 n=1 Tax=Trichosurus vulpecula TaxID=9337 RepID=UPI00186B47D6|nr:thioredoxin-related transmembrane protein 4 [Trichosurus vulpecula]
METGGRGRLAGAFRLFLPVWSSQRPNLGYPPLRLRSQGIGESLRTTLKKKGRNGWGPEVVSGGWEKKLEPAPLPAAEPASASLPDFQSLSSLLPFNMAGPSAREARGPGAPSFVAVAVAVAMAMALTGPSQAAAAAAGQEEQSRVRAMTSSNWTLVLEGEWMLKFYAPWCPACLQTESEWETFAKNGEILDVSVGKVDVTQEPGLSGRFFVTTLPTIFHAKDGIFRRYRGPGISKDLQDYILQKKWKAVEPVAGWKSPSSITMSGMAGLFSLSGWIRQLHNYFTGTLGIPVWGSYFIFVVATLMIGLILGLILVLLADCFCPPKPRDGTDQSELIEKEKEALIVEDLGISEGKKDLSDEEEEKDDLSEAEEDKEDLSEREEERTNSNDETSEEDSAVDEGSATEDAGNVPDQQLTDTEAESSVRQRKSHVADGEQ